MSQAFISNLSIYIRAGYPIINIVSSEEDRARELIDEMLRQEEMVKRARKLFVWTISRGLVDAQGRPASKEDTHQPEHALAFVAGYQWMVALSKAGRFCVMILTRGSATPAHFRSREFRRIRPGWHTLGPLRSRQGVGAEAPY